MLKNYSSSIIIPYFPKKGKNYGIIYIVENYSSNKFNEKGEI